ncbi:hypothetical protein C5Y93_00225 [Blastopirellula marina]|uniref:Uncharacterized protein n=1 Tax=Blastopirellula marina TaxID=124 RepID=A0A2S8GUR4_9BACT|nr:hypothetical protein C5Y93_00225 [Blastopirellula marina]
MPTEKAWCRICQTEVRPEVAEQNDGMCVVCREYNPPPPPYGGPWYSGKRLIGFLILIDAYFLCACVVLFGLNGLLEIWPLPLVSARLLVACLCLVIGLSLLLMVVGNKMLFPQKRA